MGGGEGEGAELAVKEIKNTADDKLILTGTNSTGIAQSVELQTLS